MIQPTQKAQRGDEYLEVYFVSTPIPIRYLISARFIIVMCRRVVLYLSRHPLVHTPTQMDGWKIIIVRGLQLKFP